MFLKENLMKVEGKGEDLNWFESPNFPERDLRKWEEETPIPSYLKALVRIP